MDDSAGLDCVAAPIPAYERSYAYLRHSLSAPGRHRGIEGCGERGKKVSDLDPDELTSERQGPKSFLFFSRACCAQDGRGRGKSVGFGA